MMKERIPLRNYKKIREALAEIIADCDKKKKTKGGRVNPGPLRDKVRRIRRMVQRGSYPPDEM